MLVLLLAAAVSGPAIVRRRRSAALLKREPSFSSNRMSSALSLPTDAEFGIFASAGVAVLSPHAPVAMLSDGSFPASDTHGGRRRRRL